MTDGEEEATVNSVTFVLRGELIEFLNIVGYHFFEFAAKRVAFAMRRNSSLQTLLRRGRLCRLSLHIVTYLSKEIIKLYLYNMRNLRRLNHAHVKGNDVRYLDAALQGLDLLAERLLTFNRLRSLLCEIFDLLFTRAHLLLVLRINAINTTYKKRRRKEIAALKRKRRKRIRPQRASARVQLWSQRDRRS